MTELVNKYLEWLEARNYSSQTVRHRRYYLDYFVQWADDRGVTKPTEVNRPMLERYQLFLYNYRKKNGDPISFGTQNSYLVPIRSWFKWLARQNYILYNPAAELELPKNERRLPKHILTASEAEQVIAVADVATPTGLRDRAIMETFYSTGIRRMELVSLQLYDLDAERGTVIIRQGKGKKDRMIPIGDRALAWIDKYLTEVRPRFLCGDAGRDVVFLTHKGEPFTRTGLSLMIRDYVRESGIGKKGSCHLFRHTMATLMCENGADIRMIQAMLGHADLNTTQVYVQVAIRQLKQVYDATHPAQQSDKHPNLRSNSAEVKPEGQPKGQPDIRSNSAEVDKPGERSNEAS